jgi:predicted nucleic acid-binding protein
MIAFDTNVFIYSVDQTNAVKQAQARQLITHWSFREDAVLLWQVAVELLRWLRWAVGKQKIQEEAALVAYAEVRGAFPLVLPTPVVLDGALRIYADHSISHWDSVLLAACLEAQVDTLYTEDLTHGLDYSGVKVINPFVA